MARKNVSIFEARRILERLCMKKEHLIGILALIEKDMGAGVDYGAMPTTYPEEGKPDVVVEGGETTINVGQGGARQLLTPQDIEAYRARMEPVKTELEELHATIVGVEMALERAELDTQVTVDV